MAILQEKPIRSIRVRYRQNLSRFGMQTQSGSPAMTGSVLRDFPDVEQVSGYAYAALTWAVEQGLINGIGTPEGALLAPHGYASRAQVATILMAYCDR